MYKIFEKKNHKLMSNFVVNILVIIIMFTMSIAIINISYFNLKRSITNTAKDNISKILIDNKKILDNSLENKFISLQGIAELSQVKSMNWDIQYPILLSKAEEYGFKHLFIMAKDGLCYYAESNTIKDQSNEIFFNDVTGNKKYITEPFIISENQFSIITLSVPIFDENTNFIGNLCGVIDLNSMNDIVQDIEIGESGYGFIINKYGDFIVHKDMNVVYDRVNLNESIGNEYEYLKSYSKLTEKVGSKDIEIQKINVKGEEHFVFSTTLENMTWLLNISVSEKSLFSTITNIIIIEIFICSISIALVTLILFRYRRNLKRNLDDIKEFSKELSNKNWTYVIDTSNRDKRDDFLEVINKLNAAIVILRKESIVNTAFNKSIAGKDKNYTKDDNIFKILENLQVNLHCVISSVGELSKHSFDLLDTYKEEVISNYNEIQVEIDKGEIDISKYDEKKIESLQNLDKKINRLIDVINSISENSKSISKGLEEM